MITRRERWILAATAALAIGAPVGAAAWVDARCEALASRLAATGGIEARIGGVDADLTGAIRITDVALGDLLSAEAIEASVAMGSLLGGTLRADEIRVDGPRVAIEIDDAGDSDLARLARRLLQRGAAPATTSAARASGLRRIVVGRGALSARIAGLGELIAEGVELIPDARGVRMVTGRVALRGATHALDVEVALDLGFARSAADLSLPQLQLGRVLAVGGAGTIATGGHTAAVREVAAGRLAPRGPLEVTASLDDAGIARPLALEIRRDAGELALAFRGDRIPLDPLAPFAPRGLALAGAHASGSLTLHRRPHALAIELDGALDQLVIDHPSLAAEPVALSGALRAELLVTPTSIALARAGLELGAARWTASGWLRRGAPVSGQLQLALASAPCADLLASLPATLRGPVDGLVVTGALGGTARLALDLAAPPGEGATLTRAFTGRCDVAAEPPAADVGTLVVAGDQQLADGSIARIGRGEPGYVELRRLPSHVTGAFVSAEDARFWDHDGFDLFQIARSLEIDVREHRLARGGSTISQQLVKNAFLSQRRTFDRKLQEAILTWRLEARLDKKQILERYLNIVELGPRVFGITAGARHWFDVGPRDLTVRQAAFLAALTSAPSSMSRRVRQAGALDPESAERVAVVLRAMKRDGAIDADTYDEARHEPLGFAPGALRE